MPDYRFESGESRFQVKAAVAGPLSFMGHSPTFAVGDFQGRIHFDPRQADGVRLNLIASVGSLTFLSSVTPSNRNEIERRMREEVLEIARFPTVKFEGFESVVEPLTADEFRVFVRGRFSLHGVTQIEDIETRLQLYTDGVQITGGFELSQSRYGIRPVTVLGGAIRLEDRLKLGFELIGRPDARGNP